MPRLGGTVVRTGIVVTLGRGDPGKPNGGQGYRIRTHRGAVETRQSAHQTLQLVIGHRQIIDVGVSVMKRSAKALIIIPIHAQSPFQA